MEKQDQLAVRFSGLLGTGMSKEDAWKVIAVEVLADVGMIAPQQLGPPAIPLRRTESGKIPIYESKLIKVVRIDPLQRTIESEPSSAALGKSRVRQRVMLPPRAQSFVRQYVSVSVNWRGKTLGGKAYDFLEVQPSLLGFGSDICRRARIRLEHVPVTEPYEGLNCMVFLLFAW